MGGNINTLISKCGPWIQADSFPAEVIEIQRGIQAAASTLQKEIERADSVDLNTITTRWGDKDTVRKSRKMMLDFTQRVISRLDDIDSRLREPANQAKAAQSASVQSKRTQVAAENISQQHANVSATPQVVLEPAAPPAKKQCQDPSK